MSVEDLTIRPYEAGDEERILALFNDVFAEDDPGYHQRALASWHWEYLDNPAGTQVVLAVEPEGRVVAQYACLPTRVHLRGADVCCGQGVDSVVHADYRRGLRKDGAFMRTARYYFEHFGIPSVNAFGYGFPNDKAYRVGVKLLKYIPVAAPVTTLARNLFESSDDTTVGAGATTEGEIVELPRCDARVNRLWKRLEPDLPMAIRRDSVYLDWRYVDCPVGDYKLFGLTSGDELRALCVVRPDWTGPPILAVSEWLVEPRDHGAAARLMAHVVAHARATSQQRVEVWLPRWHPQHPFLSGHGFFNEASPFNLCVKLYLPDLTQEWVAENWYWSIGDADVF